MTIYRQENNLHTPREIGEQADNMTEAPLVNSDRVRLQKIYDTLRLTTQNQKLLDFFWFSPEAVFNKIVCSELYRGLWVNDVHVHMTPYSEIVLSNNKAQVTINSPNNTPRSISFADDDISVDNVKYGLLPILIALADMTDYEYDNNVDENIKADNNNVEEVKPDESAPKQKIFSTVNRPRVTRKKSLINIRNLLSGHLESPEALDALSIQVRDLYQTIAKILNSSPNNSIVVNGVKFALQSEFTGAPRLVYSVRISTEKWFVDLEMIEKSKVTVYSAFAHLDGRDQDEVKEVAKVVSAIHALE